MIFKFLELEVFEIFINEACETFWSVQKQQILDSTRMIKACKICFFYCPHS